MVFARKFLDCGKAEKAVHEHFREYRARDGREFFEISVTNAISKILELEGAVEDEEALSAGKQYFFLYLASFGFIRRIGLFKATLKEDESSVNKSDLERLKTILKKYYSWSSNIDDIQYNPLCEPMEEYRGVIESKIIDSIKECAPKTSRVYLEYDGQTLIKRNEWVSFPDPYSGDVRLLYETTLDALTDFVSECDIDSQFRRKQREVLKGNF
jgi:hypothetical protein